MSGWLWTAAVVVAAATGGFVVGFVRGYNTGWDDDKAEAGW